VGARSKARKRALDVLFEADQRKVTAADVLRRQVSNPQGPPNSYLTTLVEGATAHLAAIDELLTTYSTEWPLDRMPAVDRAALRLGTYELVWCDDVPTAVVIDEWVELVKQLSTDDSPAFVNGLLGRVAEAAAATQD
jgi:N utilization substance protein B